jgi:class 3 adenylate cyclase/tetratricopeptide (TPR) repeat protein
VSSLKTEMAADLRQWVTVLHADLPQGARTQGALNPAQQEHLLQRIGAAFAQAVERHGGRVNHVDHDGWQAVFGWPEASDRDATYAVDAALDLQQALGELESAQPPLAGGLSARVGIHGAVTALRDSGGAIQFIGELPAIAHLLCLAAAAGEVLVTEESLGPYLYAYSSLAVATPAINGLGAAARVRRVVGRLAGRSRYQATTTRGMARFVGRDAELQDLRRALREAIEGRPGLVALRAQAGVGKTRLAEEFLREAQLGGCQVLRGECEAGLGNTPLRPFSDMFRRRWPLDPAHGGQAIGSALGHLVARIDPSSVQHVPALLALLGLGVDGSPVPAGAAAGPAGRSALLALLRALAGKAPLVVFIDDWQWADDATREATFQLLATPSLRVLVLAAVRSSRGGDVSLASHRVIELPPLSAPAARAAIADLLPGGEPFVVEDLVRWSGGNPLYIEELCHYVARHRRLPGMPSDSGPAWLESLTESRLNTLTPPMRQLLDAAAVIGMSPSLPALMNLAGCSPDDEQLAGLALQDFLYPAEGGDEWRFKHELTHRVVYAAIDPSRRQDLHRRMALWLNPAGDQQAEVQHCEALAHHWAGAAEPALAARYGELAGDRAMANSSVDLAKIQYRAVLDMLEQLPDTAERYQLLRSVTRRFGLACVFDPGEAEVCTFQRALQEARRHGDPPGAAFAEYWLAYSLYALGHNRQALIHARSCLALATAAADRELALHAQAMLAQVFAASGDTVQAEAMFELTIPVISRLRASGVPVGPGLSYLLACQGCMLGDFGRFDEAEDCFSRALQAVPSAGHEVNGSVLCLRACVRLWSGRHDEALADAQQAEAVGAQVRSQYIYAMGRALTGRARWCRQEGPSARRSIAEATAWLQAHGQQLFVSLNHGWLAEAAAAEGDASKVREHARLALARARQGDVLGLPMALRALARVEAQAGGAARAVRHLDLADRIARRRRSSHEHRANDDLRAQAARWRGRWRDLATPRPPNAAP